MTPNVTTPCALGITEETLSALRDGLLDAAEARQLGYHARTCAACQARLRAFDAVGGAVAAQRVPDLQASVWHGLQRRIARDGGRRTMRRGPLFGGLAAVAAVLLVALFAAVLLNAHSAGPISGTPTASQVTTPTATVKPTATALASGGWQPAALPGLVSGSDFILFALSDPATAYANLNGGNSSALVVSHDGGVTWSAPLTLPIAGYMDVNPTNARDLLLASQDNQAPNAVYRSFDGGAHWTRLTNLGSLTFEALGWAGSTAFVLTHLTENPVTSAAELYASHNGGAFTRVDQNYKLGGFDVSQSSLVFISGHGNTFFLTFGQTVQPAGTITVRSTDRGATWQQVTFKDAAGQVIDAYSASTDGHVLVGAYRNTPNRAARSTDDGATWRAAPDLLSPGADFAQIEATPDGTLFATAGSVSGAGPPDNNIYELAPGASAWVSLLAMPAGNGYLYPFYAQANGSGHPVALWETASGVLYVNRL